MRVISIIGHERHGKDTCAKILRDKIALTGKSVLIYSNATPLKAVVSEILGISVEDMETLKDMPHIKIRGKNIREWLIYYSEEVFKKNFGQDLYARAFESLANTTNVDYIIKTDDRYEAEFKATEKFAHNYLGIVRDSIPPVLGTPYYENIVRKLEQSYIIENNYKLEDLHANIYSYLTSYLFSLT